MQRILIFGNVGSGKSTMARHLSELLSIPHLDLDKLVWLPGHPGVKRSKESALASLYEFIDHYDDWVVEGGDTALLSAISYYCNDMRFLSPGSEVCQANVMAKEWEPYKYLSPEQQKADLPRLLDWVKSYEGRDDDFGWLSHRDMYDRFDGLKSEYHHLPRLSLFEYLQQATA